MRGGGEQWALNSPVVAIEGASQPLNCFQTPQNASLLHFPSPSLLVAILFTPEFHPLPPPMSFPPLQNLRNKPACFLKTEATSQTNHE